MVELTKHQLDEITKILEHDSEYGTIIHACLSGSHAYGTSRPDSDLDIRGVFMANVDEFLKFQPPIQELELDGDVKFFEIRKFLSLCLKGNPHQLEILFSPRLSERETITWKTIRSLLDNGHILNKDAIRSAYGGYAKGEYENLKRNPNHPRYLKRWGHIFRLFDQGCDLLSNGTMNVKLDNDSIEFIKAVYDKQFTESQLNALYEEKDAKFRRCYEFSKLPPDSNWNKVEQTVIEIRTTMH